MIEQLQIIKPKRIKDTLNATLSPNSIVLEFGITKVFIPCSTVFTCACSISQKDLYTYTFDNAKALTEKYTIPKVDLKWEECIINVADTTVFSAFSASGDDECFIGTIEIDSKLKLSLYGFTYYGFYESPKMRNESKLVYHIDYQVFYYLFQMFKSLSGKKTDKLLWALSGEDLVLTDEAKSFYVICTKDDNTYRFKTKCLSLLIDFYKKETTGEKQLFKKAVAEEAESIAKHLIRPFDDVLKSSENNFFTKMEGNGYKLCLNKPKS